MTSFWRYNDVIIMSCVRWNHADRCRFWSYWPQRYVEANLLKYLSILRVHISWYPVKLLLGECHIIPWMLESTLARLMVWCRQSTRHYLSQCISSENSWTVWYINWRYIKTCLILLCSIFSKCGKMMMKYHFDRILYFSGSPLCYDTEKKLLNVYGSQITSK